MSDGAGLGRRPRPRRPGGEPRHALGQRIKAAARAAHQADGLEILGVIHDDSAQNAAAFAATYNAEWPLLDDVEDVAWTAYHGFAVPVSYFIDRAGIVRAVSYGPPPSASLDSLLAKIL